MNISLEVTEDAPVMLMVEETGAILEVSDITVINDLPSAEGVSF